MKRINQLTVIILIFAASAFLAYGSGSKEEGPSMMMMDSEDTGTMTADEGKEMRGGKVTFTSLDAARELAAHGPVVLFFHADWCPTCQAAMKDVNEHSGKLKDITVVVVDYDRADDLKEKYMIPYQHTYVQIDEEGNKVVIWNGGGVDEILDNIQRDNYRMEEN
jgi:thioredoxin 1